MSRRKRTTRRKQYNFGGVLVSPSSVPAVSVTPEIEGTAPAPAPAPAPAVATPAPSVIETVAPETTATATTPVDSAEATPGSTPEQDATLVEEAAVGAAAGAAAGAGAAAAALPSDASGAQPTKTVEEERAMYIYLNPEGIMNQISTQANEDPAYSEVGIIHVSDSAAINAARGFVTGVSNFFGSKGFDNSVFDYARNDALNKMKSLLTDTQKVCNLRMETSSDPTLVFVHMYGTLLEQNTASATAP